MPSTTPPQARLMAAIAHGWHKPGGGGPSVKVAREFNQADKGSAMLSKGMKPVDAAYASGGPVLGRARDFLKEPTPFVTDKETTDYEKGKGSSKLSSRTGNKSLKVVKPRS
jgi:hypothetical protein